MKNKILAVTLFVGLFAIFSKTKAQYQLLQLVNLITAKKLSGIVVNQLGSRLPNVTVNRSKKGWRKIIQSGKTNVRGMFSF